MNFLFYFSTILFNVFIFFFPVEMSNADFSGCSVFFGFVNEANEGDAAWIRLN